ncbi:MAG: tRNA lysidine(34) synthetase TilS [Lachnospiraceae bacterium]|nr:tRNA lysidine(34) synthetase TilS [Lachnospiraceae bacterium]
MDKDIASYIIENDMLRTGDCVIAAVSGGADSMCMLFCLSELAKEMSLSLHAVHVNHGIRGAEADGDEAFVRDYCAAHDIPFTAVHEDVPAIARKEGKTLEEAGREVRYNALFKVARELNASAVALAHNQSDRAETVLLNLLRGSGITGGAGIRPVTHRSGIKLIRPLLSISRNRIEEILAEAGISFRTDSTNLSDEHTRNRLRSMVFPLLTQEVNARSVEHLCDFARDMAEVSDLIDSEARDIIEKAVEDGSVSLRTGKVRIGVKLLKSLPAALQTGVIRLLIPKLTSSLKDISRTHISSIIALMGAGTSKTVSLPYGLTATRTRDFILIGTTDEPGEQEPAESFFETKVITGDARASALTLIATDSSDPFSNKNCTKWFDYDNICENLEFRYPKPGDTIPVMIGGRICRKEVAKVFREAGITAKQAGSVPIVACGDSVIWIPGLRRCDAHFVTPETKTIIEITRTRT